MLHSLIITTTTTTRMMTKTITTIIIVFAVLFTGHLSITAEFFTGKNVRWNKVTETR